MLVPPVCTEVCVLLVQLVYTEVCVLLVQLVYTEVCAGTASTSVPMCVCSWYSQCILRCVLVQPVCTEVCVLLVQLVCTEVCALLVQPVQVYRCVCAAGTASVY